MRSLVVSGWVPISYADGPLPLRSSSSFRRYRVRRYGVVLHPPAEGGNLVFASRNQRQIYPYYGSRTGARRRQHQPGQGSRRSYRPVSRGARHQRIGKAAGAHLHHDVDAASSLQHSRACRSCSEKVTIGAKLLRMQVVGCRGRRRLRLLTSFQLRVYCARRSRAALPSWA
jgi:hypothetical protein